jgi:hypothetical protein
MQKMMTVGAALMTATLWMGSAEAMSSGKFKGEAVLAKPTAEVVETKVAGVKWRCEGTLCIGAGPAYSGLDDLQKECGKLSAAVGPLAGFKSRGRVVAGEKLDICNRLAGQDEPQLQADASR